MHFDTNEVGQAVLSWSLQVQSQRIYILHAKGFGIQGQHSRGSWTSTRQPLAKWPHWFRDYCAWTPRLLKWVCFHLKDTSECSLIFTPLASPSIFTEGLGPWTGRRSPSPSPLSQPVLWYETETADLKPTLALALLNTRVSTSSYKSLHTSVRKLQSWKC